MTSQKTRERARRFLALDGRVADLRIKQGAIVNEQVDSGESLEDFAQEVDRSERSLLAYRDVYLFCGDDGLVDGASFQAHRSAAEAGKDRKWLVTQVSRNGGRIRSDEVRKLVGQKVANKGEIERATQVFTSRPDGGSHLARVIAENKQLAREVATNRKASGSIERERQEVIRERLAKANLYPGRRDPDFDTPIEVLTALRELAKAVVNVKAAYRAITDTPITDEIRGTLLESMSRLEDAVEALHRRVDGDEVDAALRQIMESTE